MVLNLESMGLVYSRGKNSLVFFGKSYSLQENRFAGISDDLCSLTCLHGHSLLVSNTQSIFRSSNLNLIYAFSLHKKRLAVSTIYSLMFSNMIYCIHNVITTIPSMISNFPMKCTMLFAYRLQLI